MGFGNTIGKPAVFMLTGPERRNTSGASWHFGGVNRAKRAAALVIAWVREAKPS
jgi:hypothetical protein